MSNPIPAFFQLYRSAPVACIPQVLKYLGEPVEEGKDTAHTDAHSRMQALLETRNTGLGFRLEISSPRQITD